MTMAKKTIENELSLSKESGWIKLNEKEKNRIISFAEKYKQFIEQAKTERETVKSIIDSAKKKQFKDIFTFKKLNKYDKVYITKNGKAIALVIIGEKSLNDGIRIVASHLDSPRIDMKPNPIIEDSESSTAILKTQYYGGIRKYHWVNRPLALYGVVFTKNNKKIEIKIGDKEKDPVFVIPDLLPHLSRKVQGDRKLDKGIEGEELNVIIGSIPIEDKDIKSKIKTNILKYLNDEYGLKESDLNRADIEIVPSEKPRDVGFDRSLVGAYGQDDRVCVYTSLQAILSTSKPKYTVISLFYDKEEIGSDGNTGAQSTFIDLVITKLLNLKEKRQGYADFVECLHNSKALSADVDAAINPSYKQVHDLSNAAKAGYGIVLTKYTGYG